MIIRQDYSKEYYKWLRDLHNNRRNTNIIFINGCFDILHLGHIKMFKWALTMQPLLSSDRDKTSKLIIGLNSDLSVLSQNKNHALINDENYRASFLNEFADDIVIFDNHTPERLILDILPNYIIKGKEYKNKNIIEKHMAPVLDFIIRYYDSGVDISTTKIIERIKKS